MNLLTGCKSLLFLFTLSGALYAQLETIPKTCQEALENFTSVGCEFWPADLDHAGFPGSDTLPFGIVVANPHGSQTAQVTIEHKEFTSPIVRNLAPETTEKILLSGKCENCPIPPQELEFGGIGRGAGYRLTSNIPVQVYQWSPIERFEVSTDASMLIPSTHMTGTYLVAAWGKGPDGSTSQITIVATKDNTTITFIPTVDVEFIAGIGTINAGESSAPIILNASDVLAITARNTNADLTGSRIDSDKPLTVFGGHECASVVTSSCNHAQEQVLPLSSWGTSAVLGPFAARENCEKNDVMFRMIAGADDMTLTFDPPAPEPYGSSYSIAKQGEIIQFLSDKDHYVEGIFNNPVDPRRAAAPFLSYLLMPSAVYSACDYVDTYAQGDPMMVIIPPTGQFLHDYIFHVLQTGKFNYDNIIITRSEGTEVTLGCKGVLPDSIFKQVGNSRWEVGRVHISHPNIPTGCSKGTNRLTATRPVGVIAAGVGGADSYGYLGGIAVRPTNIQIAFKRPDSTVIVKPLSILEGDEFMVEVWYSEFDLGESFTVHLTSSDGDSLPVTVTRLPDNENIYRGTASYSFQDPLDPDDTTISGLLDYSLGADSALISAVFILHDTLPITNTFTIVDPRTDEVDITFRTSDGKLIEGTLSDVVEEEVIVQVKYNNPYEGDSFVVDLITDTGDTLQVQLSETSSGKNKYQGTINVNFQNPINAKDLFLSGLRGPSTPTALITATFITPVNNTFTGTLEIENVAELTSISFETITGDPITELTDQESQFVVVLSYNQGARGQNQEVLLTTQNGDTLTVTVNPTGTQDTYKGTVDFGFKEPQDLSTQDNEISGLLDWTQTVSNDVITAVFRTQTEQLSISSTYNPVERAWIIDGNKDGRADTLYIEFKAPVVKPPESIPSIQWPDNTVEGKSAEGDQISMVPGSDRIILVDLSEDPFPLGATGATTTDAPTLTMIDGNKKTITDSIGPMITEVRKNPSSGHYLLQDGAGNLTKKIFPDTLVITLSEPISTAEGGEPWNQLLEYFPESKLNDAGLPLVISNPPVVSNNGLTLTVTIEHELEESEFIQVGDYLQIREDAPYTDNSGNPPLQDFTIPVDGDDYAGVRVNAYVLEPILSTYELINPNQSISSRESDIVKEVPVLNMSGEIIRNELVEIPVYWIRPPHMRADGTINEPRQTACSDAEKDTEEFTSIYSGCLSIIMVLTRMPYTATVNIFDHMGGFVHASTQKFGYCGEMQNQARLTSSGEYRSFLIWNQKEVSGNYVGSGVYIWNVVLTFENGFSKVIVRKQGIARSDDPAPNCALGE